MKILLQVWDSDEFADTQCDYAFVDLTPEYAGEILKRIELAKRMRAEDESFHCADFWSGADYLPNYDDLEKILTKDGKPALKELAEKEYAILRDDFEVPSDKWFADREIELPRVECEYMTVCSDGDVRWKAFPRHTDIRVMTSYIPETVIREAAGLEATDAS